MWDLSALTRDQTCIPSIARQILNCWTTREVLEYNFKPKHVGICPANHWWWSSWSLDSVQIIRILETTKDLDYIIHRIKITLLKTEDSWQFYHYWLVFPFLQDNWQILTCNTHHGKDRNWWKGRQKVRLTTQNGHICKGRNSMKVLNKW